MRLRLMIALLAIPLSLSLAPVTIADEAGGLTTPLWTGKLKFTGGPTSTEKVEGSFSNPFEAIHVAFKSDGAAGLVTVKAGPSTNPAAVEKTFLVVDGTTILVSSKTPTREPDAGLLWQVTLEGRGLSSESSGALKGAPVDVEVYGAERFEEDPLVSGPPLLP